MRFASFPAVILAFTVLAIARAATGNQAILDSLTLGDSASEQAHSVAVDHSDVIRGGLGEPARRLLPREPENWEGGQIAFTLKVDPNKPNYLTLRLWGDDVTNNRLILYTEGKQIGYRHLGDVDDLDFGCDAPGYNGRFYYTTTPLPVELTRGKDQLHLEIRATGPVWSYGTNFAQYQKPITEPTRGLYRVYTHTDGCFIPPPDEKQGSAPDHLPVRTQPGPEVLVAIKKRVNSEVAKLLSDKRPLNQVEMHFLARAYYVKWTPAYQNPKAAEQIAAGCDALFAAFSKDPAFAQADPAVYNDGWFGLGLAGGAVALLGDPLGPMLDQPIPGGNGMTRRAGWSQMLQASRDWHRQHRRLYTNQSMITDLNLYRANRGVAAIDPAHAMPENLMLAYLYQSVGLEPWLGNDTDHGPDRWMGDHYFQLTAKGLTRELGFVGYYGEVLDWVTQIYDATRPTPDEPGDPKIKQQLEKIARARAAFRYPMLDESGNRAMRAETIVGWRDVHFPGDVCYGERPTWDASPLYTAAATLDPDSVGYAQQMFADNQFFATIEEQMKQHALRDTAALLGVPDQYDLITAQPPSAVRLPMTPGQGDFVFSDEQDGVIAIKHRDEILYASLYWRARPGINFLARVHFLQSQYSNIAVVREETEFDPSGMTYTRPDWTNFGFAGGGLHYPGAFHSAMAGEKMPIAKIPDGVKFKPGDESPYAGKGTFYTLRYGNYLIGMNCTDDRSFDLPPPAGRETALELVSGKLVGLTGPIKVAPQSTVVFYLDR